MRALLASVAAASSMAVVVACATDESSLYVEPDAGSSVVPPADSGVGDANVDADVAVLPYVCPADELCPNTLFDPNHPGGGLDLRTRIQVIRGRSASDVWAVGVQGATAHFDGTSWTKSNTGTKETMNALWLRESEEIALASIGSVFTRGLEALDGGAADAGPATADGWTARGAPRALTAIPNENRLLSSSWAAPGAEWLWCTTVEAPFNSASTPNGLWRLHVAPATNALEIAGAFPSGMCAVLPCSKMTSVHGSSADDLWAVGYTGATVRITDAQSDKPSLAAFDSKTWAALHGVWTASASDAWAVGGNGVIRHYTGHPTAWDVVADVPATETLRAVWGTSASDVWAVGDDAAVLHYGGTSWERVKVGGLGERRPNLYTVWSSAPGEVWIGGDGVILSLGGKS
jgi:hypothetical protein